MSSLQKAFEHCETIAKSHYENFPIGWFVPKPSRKYLYAIYAFARTADDFSDEAQFRQDGLKHLEDFEVRLEKASKGNVSEDDLLFWAISETLQRTGIPSKLLKDLLIAFKMDLTKNRYQTYQELETYCVYSANPIGRIVLLLYGYTDPQLHLWSDKICTGIQLVNHWQDIAVDLKKDRVYLPKEDMNRFGYSYENLFEHRLNDSFVSLLRFEISRARSLFLEGRPLLKSLEWRLRLQITLMWKGPMYILDLIENNQYDVFKNRPKLSKLDLMKLFLKRF